MDFKTKIDRYMQENSIKNLKQLATKSSIAYTTLRDCYEKNNADHSRMLTIRKLAQYMNCTTDYLGYEELINPHDTSETLLTNNTNTNQNLNLDDFEILFNKNKDILTSDDKDYIKFIIEKRKKETSE